MGLFRHLSFRTRQMGKPEPIVCWGSDSRKSDRDKREWSSNATNWHPKPTVQTPNTERDSLKITIHTPVTEATKVESNSYSIKKDDPNRKAPTTAKSKRNQEGMAIKPLPEDVKEMSNLILQNHCIKCETNFHRKTSCKDEVSKNLERRQASSSKKDI